MCACVYMCVCVCVYEGGGMGMGVGVIRMWESSQSINYGIRSDMLVCAWEDVLFAYYSLCGTVCMGVF